MNLRILKKLSKRAAPLLPLMGDDREQFRAEADYNYHSAFIGDRKHWERSHCHSTYEGRNDWNTPRGEQIVFTSRAGRRIVMQPPSHPRVGTIMVGATTGYYEPEWSEESAWDALVGFVTAHFTDWMPDEEWIGEDPPDPVLIRKLDTVQEIFRAAHDIIASEAAQ